MRRAFLQALVIFLLFVVPLAVLWLRLHPETVADSASLPSGGETPEQKAVDGASADPTDRASEPVPATESTRALETEWGAALAEARNARDRRAGLRRVAADLEAMPAAGAVARILTYLRSGQDVASGLPFAPGPGGQLTTAPTLRVWLIDWLGRIDPVAAARLSQEVFAAGPLTSADEWAMHLRNHARGLPEERDAVVSAAFVMLAHSPWRAAPSIGFLESFDALVWGRDPQAVEALLPLIPERGRSLLRPAANLALDRLVLNQPGDIIPILVENLSALDGDPFIRAGYVARAELYDPEQRNLVEDYFLERRLSGAERDYFLEMVPNLNLTFSHSLLTENPDQTLAWADAHIEGTVEALRDWLNDPRFQAWRNEIEAALRRLSP